jgi:hypothetical protein
VSPWTLADTAVRAHGASDENSGRAVMSVIVANPGLAHKIIWRMTEEVI